MDLTKLGTEDEPDLDYCPAGPKGESQSVPRQIPAPKAQSVENQEDAERAREPIRLPAAISQAPSAKHVFDARLLGALLGGSRRRAELMLEEDADECAVEIEATAPEHQLEGVAHAASGKKVLAWNSYGSVSKDFEANRVHVEYAAPDSERQPPILDHDGFTMAALTEDAAVFGVGRKGSASSKVLIRPAERWDRAFFRVVLPPGEEVMAVAIGDSFVAVLTPGQLRLLGHSGVHLAVIALPGRPVAMAARKHLLFVVTDLACDADGAGEGRSLEYVLLDVFKKKRHAEGRLPLCPDVSLAWLGISSEMLPLVVDSAGVVQVLVPGRGSSLGTPGDGGLWTPVLDIGVEKGCRLPRIVSATNWGLRILALSADALITVPFRLPLGPGRELGAATDSAVEEFVLREALFARHLDEAWAGDLITRDEWESALDRTSQEKRYLRLFVSFLKGQHSLALDVARCFADCGAEGGSRLLEKAGRLLEQAGMKPLAKELAKLRLVVSDNAQKTSVQPPRTAQEPSAAPAQSGSDMTPVRPSTSGMANAPSSALTLMSEQSRGASAALGSDDLADRQQEGDDEVTSATTPVSAAKLPSASTPLNPFAQPRAGLQRSASGHLLATALVGAKRATPAELEETKSPVKVAKVEQAAVTSSTAKGKSGGTSKKGAERKGVDKKASEKTGGEKAAEEKVAEKTGGEKAAEESASNVPKSVKRPGGLAGWRQGGATSSISVGQELLTPYGNGAVEMIRDYDGQPYALISLVKGGQLGVLKADAQEWVLPVQGKELKRASEKASSRKAKAPRLAASSAAEDQDRGDGLSAKAAATKSLQSFFGRSTAAPKIPTPSRVPVASPPDETDGQENSSVAKLPVAEGDALSLQAHAVTCDAIAEDTNPSSSASPVEPSLADKILENAAAMNDALTSEDMSCWAYTGAPVDDE